MRRDLLASPSAAYCGGSVRRGASSASCAGPVQAMSGRRRHARLTCRPRSSWSRCSVTVAERKRALNVLTCPDAAKIFGAATRYRLSFFQPVLNFVVYCRLVIRPSTTSSSWPRRDRDRATGPLLSDLRRRVLAALWPAQANQRSSSRVAVIGGLFGCSPCSCGSGTGSSSSRTMLMIFGEPRPSSMCVMRALVWCSAAHQHIRGRSSSPRSAVLIFVSGIVTLEASGLLVQQLLEHPQRTTQSPALHLTPILAFQSMIAG